MTPKKNLLFQKDYAKQLLAIAKGDLQSAEILLASASSGRKENILYMIQQSVEKALKSVLIWKGVSFPMVHDLGILLISALDSIHKH